MFHDKLTHVQDLSQAEGRTRVGTSNQQQAPRLSSGARRLTLALMIVLALLVAVCTSAKAQSFSTIYKFTGNSDGGTPYAGVTILGPDVYGTTYQAGLHGYGTVYKFDTLNNRLTALYEFAGGSDCRGPHSGVVYGPEGIFYGTTEYGGGGNCGFGCGTVYSLKPPATVCKTALCYWTETQLHLFGRGSDGYLPLGDVNFDQSGNLYGTADEGGPSGCGGSGTGVVYELSGSGYMTETILHGFAGPTSDGCNPHSNLIFDSTGTNLFGTTKYGGSGDCQYGCGTVFEMMPSGSGWNETPIYNFPGTLPSTATDIEAGVIMDSAGNLYGATYFSGTVFELSPSGSGWTVTRYVQLDVPAFCGPVGNLAMDAQSNLYGATTCGGTDQDGYVFKLTPTSDSWTFQNLHTFTGGSDGAVPTGNLVFADGNLWGTASEGGNTNSACNSGCGTIWEITGLN